MLLTIFCFASSLTSHRSENKIIFKRCLAILATELFLDTADGKTIFQAKFKRSKKLILTASRRKFSASWLPDFDEKLEPPRTAKTGL
ncbi:hypothetical protein MtrunA17_Chr5g0418251 [Medicago truncatula]|uniref:Uncharacterized protein n=1 Tax=Medicago truncatula TaxID=3880 RepID=A0A396HQ67_MEDTR|nr:hypothetical protein MtrunA17_Chr5g0418251 [Medicago truncatula]